MTLSQPSEGLASAPPAFSPLGLLRRGIESWAAAYRRRQTLHMLENLSDDRLKDIGLTRRDIRDALNHTSHRFSRSRQ